MIKYTPIMLSFGKLFCALSSNLSQLQRSTLLGADGLSKVLGGYVQTRDLGKTTHKRRTTHAPRWWVQRKRKYIEQYLTPESEKVIEEEIRESYSGSDKSPLKEPLFERGIWTPQSRRTGVIARKIGIYPMWTKDGKKFPTTVLHVLDNHVINYVPPEQVKESRYGDHYKDLGFLVVGAENGNPQLFTSRYNGLFKKAGILPKKKLTRFTISPDAALQPGTPLYATHFKAGDYVNVYGKTVGHGFQGVVKRWGFKGGRATHGTTKSHRRPGCIGAGAGRKDNIWKGKKMPGHMGQERRTVFGLEIFRINTQHNVIWVKGGSVPGSTHSYVYIMDCKHHKKKHTEENPPPFPTYYPEEQEKPLPIEIYANSVHNFTEPTISYEEPEVSKTAAKTGAKTAAKKKNK